MVLPRRVVSGGQSRKVMEEPGRSKRPGHCKSSRKAGRARGGPAGKESGPPNAVSPHCQHCIEDWKVWSRALAFPVKPHENQLLRLRNGGCRGEGRWLRFYELPKMRPGLGPCRSGHLPSRWCGAPSVQEGPRGHSDNILEPSSLASKAWWAYLCREETDPLMG